MTRLLLFVLTLVPLLASAQIPSVKRVWPVGSNQIAIADSAGLPTYFPVSERWLIFSSGYVVIGARTQGATFLMPGKFLNQGGTPWGATATVAATAWQNAVVAAGASGGGGGTVPVIVTASNQNVTGVGTIAAGAYFISIANIGTEAGTVDGQPLEVETTLTYPVATGMTYGALTYNATGTKFKIITSR